MSITVEYDANKIELTLSAIKGHTHVVAEPQRLNKVSAKFFWRIGHTRAQDPTHRLSTRCSVLSVCVPVDMGNAATTEGETEYAEAQAEIERLEATPNPDEQVQHKLQLSKTKLERAKLKIAVERAQEKVRLVKEKHPGDDERIKDVARELLDAQQALDHEEKVKRKEELNDPVSLEMCLEYFAETATTVALSRC